MVEKKFFGFDQKKLVFMTNLEVKLSFVLYTSAYVIYQWYLMNKAENLGFWRTLDNGFETGLVVM